MNFRDPKVVKILLAVVILGTLSYMYFGTTFLPFGYQVRKARTATLEQEFSKLSADLEKARKTVGRLAQLEAEYDRLHEQWLDAQALLPEEHEMPSLLRKVTTAGTKAGVEFMLFQPTPVEIKADYKAHPVKIKVRGGYHQLGIFLSRLANMDRIVNVTNLDVSPANSARGPRNSKKQENSRDTIVASFTLTAHTLIKGAVNETNTAQN